MSFLKFCRGCGNFTTLMLRDKEATIAKLHLGQQLSQTVVYDVYNLLELLQKHQPFARTMEITTRQKLQKDVLFKAKHPNLRSVDDELIKEWEMICTYYSKSENTLSVSLKARNGKTFLLEVCDKIDVYSFDLEGFQLLISSTTDIQMAFDIVCSYEDEANDDGAEIDAEEDVEPKKLPELPFTFKRI